MNRTSYIVMLQRAKVLMWVYLILVLALKLFGFDVIEDISYTNSALIFVDSNSFIRVIIKSILLGTLLNVMFSSVLNNYFKILIRINLIILPYAIISNVLLEFDKAGWHSALLSTLIYFVPLLFKAKLKDCLKIALLDIPFQCISFLARGYNFNLIDKRILISFVYALDYYIMWAIHTINTKVGENKCHFWVSVLSYLKKINWKTKFLSLNKLSRKQQTNLKKSSLLNVLNTARMNLKCYVKFVLIKKVKRLIPLIIFFIIYVSAALFMDKVFESILLLTSYGSFKFLYPKQFHADYIPNIQANMITFTCVSLSCLVLCTALYNTMLAEVSILSSVVVALVLDWLLYVIREYFDSINESRELKKLNLTKESIKELFVEFKTMDKYYDYLIATLVEGERDVHFFKRESNRNLNIDEQQFRNYKCKFKKMLKNKQI